MAYSIYGLFNPLFFSSLVLVSICVYSTRILSGPMNSYLSQSHIDVIGIPTPEYLIILLSL